MTKRIIIAFLICYAFNYNKSWSINDDILIPYHQNHGSKHSIRRIRSIQSSQYQNKTFESWNSHISNKMNSLAETRYFLSDISENKWIPNRVSGHYTVLLNPLKTFSVFEAVDFGCHFNITKTVEYIARKRKCIVAQNGGFFRTKSGRCIGNVISDGRIVQNASGIQNVNFGITKNGTLLTGYFSEEEVANLNFSQLIAGVIWLVRNGSSYIEESLKLEEEKSEETGTLQEFVDVISARTAIGHDRQGRIIFVQLDGQTKVAGANLKELAKFLIEELDVVNAINLDGGGSATLVLNGTLANYPSDHCKDDPMWRCQRLVPTVICAHEPYCDSVCVNGNCILGRCNCSSNWKGKSCDQLICGVTNCSQHGLCTPYGCRCDAGWHGPDCQNKCKRGRFGVNCSQICVCAEGSECDNVSGKCTCSYGYTGKFCDQECQVGRFGLNCLDRCQCNSSCFCDSITGNCLANNETDPDQPFFNVSMCLANNLHRQFILVEEHKLKPFWRNFYIICFGFGLSMLLNILLLIYNSVSFSYKSNRARSAIEDQTPFRNVDNEDDDTVQILKPSSFVSSFQQWFSISKIRYTKLNDEVESFEMN